MTGYVQSTAHPPHRPTFEQWAKELNVSRLADIRQDWGYAKQPGPRPMPIARRILQRLWP